MAREGGQKEASKNRSLLVASFVASCPGGPSIEEGEANPISRHHYPEHCRLASSIPYPLASAAYLQHSSRPFWKNRMFLFPRHRTEFQSLAGPVDDRLVIEFRISRNRQSLSQSLSPASRRRGRRGRRSREPLRERFRPALVCLWCLARPFPASSIVGGLGLSCAGGSAQLRRRRHPDMHAVEARYAGQATAGARSSLLL